ncbi:MAG: tol-pal system protein YbgF [Acidobacteria bacterium]|nr:tol-pal system protein YbgF [Acidobacteriota bacterium]
MSKTRWMVMTGASVLAGAFLGALLAPVPLGAVAKEIIQLQQDVTRLLQAQRDLQRAVDEKHAVLKTLVEQSLDAVNRVSTSNATLQKSIQEVAANTTARIDTMSTQSQGLSDNLEEVKVRLGKQSQQLAEMQNVLQSLDSKLSAGAAAPGSQPPTGANPAQPGTAPNNPPTPPPAADTLYTSAYRDFQSGKFDMARQEFTDYLKYYPDTDVTSNAQFYLGEIHYANKEFKDAVDNYDKVLDNYPKSYKLAPARMKKGMALLELGQRAAGLRELREVIRRHPNTEEARRATAKIRELAAQ